MTRPPVVGAPSRFGRGGLDATNHATSTSIDTKLATRHAVGTYTMSPSVAQSASTFMWGRRDSRTNSDGAMTLGVNPLDIVESSLAGVFAALKSR
jgi:hypothetical protein